jgi:hypothetical protein
MSIVFINPRAVRSDGPVSFESLRLHLRDRGLIAESVEPLQLRACSLGAGSAGLVIPGSVAYLSLSNTQGWFATLYAAIRACVEDAKAEVFVGIRYTTENDARMHNILTEAGLPVIKRDVHLIAKPAPAAQTPKKGQDGPKKASAQVAPKKKKTPAKKGKPQGGKPKAKEERSPPPSKSSSSSTPKKGKSDDGKPIEVDDVQPIEDEIGVSDIHKHDEGSDSGVPPDEGGLFD